MLLVLHDQSIMKKKIPLLHPTMFCWLSVCIGRRTTVKNLVKSLQAHVLSVGCKSVKGHQTDW